MYITHPPNYKALNLIEALHEYGELPEAVAHLALDVLPLENGGADLDQLAVAVQALVEPFLLRDVHADRGGRRVNVGPDHGAKVLEDEFDGGAGSCHVALVLGEQELTNGRQQVQAEVQVPDGGT